MYTSTKEKTPYAYETPSALAVCTRQLRTQMQITESHSATVICL